MTGDGMQVKAGRCAGTMNRVAAVIRHYKRLLYASTQVPVSFEADPPGPLRIVVRRKTKSRLIHSQ